MRPGSINVTWGLPISRQYSDVRRMYECTAVEYYLYTSRIVHVVVEWWPFVWQVVIQT